MQWELFNQVLVKLAAVTDLDPMRDAANYADQLLVLHPHLFERLKGGPSSVEARMAALTMAKDHLREVCSLPNRVHELQSSMANSTMSASERLVRTAGLAYLASENDLISDNTPHGLGLIDDCIVLRGARVGTPGVHGADFFIEDLTTIQYLSLAVPDSLLHATERALALAAALWERTRDLPVHTIELALLHLMEHPPSDFPPTLRLPPPSRENWDQVDAPLRLTRGQLVETRSDGYLLIEFLDGATLCRTPDASLVFS